MNAPLVQIDVPPASPKPDAPAPARHLDCQVATSFAELGQIQATWDAAVADAGGSVYLTFDWLRTWWEFYGGNRELRLFVFRNGGRIVALVPIYIDPLGVGPLTLRIARLVGANIPPKVFNPPIPADHASAVFERIIEQLLGRDRCDVISFGPVSELKNLATSLAAACDRQSDSVDGLQTVRGVHSVFALPASMEDYYASLSKNERKQRRKYELRLLKKEFAIQVEVVSDPARVSAEFEHFAEQHRLQWHAEGKSGHFGAWPRALEFNRALVRAQGALGRLRFIRIVANGEVIANQYTFAFGNRYYWELPSRVVGSQWERFSLGPTGIVTMIEQGIVEGMAYLEGGLAHYDYKVRLGAQEHAALTFRVLRRGARARFNLALFSFIRSCLSVVYHKLWYRRIAPRLPAVFWRPQSMIWLRFDF